MSNATTTGIEECKNDKKILKSSIWNSIHYPYKAFLLGAIRLIHVFTLDSILGMQ